MIWSILILPKSLTSTNSTVACLIVLVQEIWDTIARRNLKGESAKDRVHCRQHLRKITGGILDYLIEISKVELAIVEDMAVQEIVRE